MKKIFLTLSLALTALVVSAAVGDKVEKGNVSYTVTTMPTSDAYGRVTVSGLSASGKAATNLSLFIPSIIYIDSKEYEVFDIAKSAFSGCTNINTVSINYGLWGICASAFQGCTNLKMLRIPSTCLSIEANAFYGCSKLFEVYFAKADPRGYLYSASAFPSNSNMTLFTTKTDPNSAQYAKAVTAFSKFTTVKKSSYAYDLSTSDGAMLVVTKHPGKGVRGEVALVGIQTSMLGSDKIFKPYNYNGVDGYLYTLTSVADSACINLTDLKGIDLTTAPSLATIGVRSFYGCTALSTATLNEGLTTIKSSAFAFDALTTITLPKTVTSCSAYFVDRCKQLYAILVAAGNTKYSSHYQCLYNADGTTLLRCPESMYANMYFSKNVKSIGAYAFDNCTNLTRVDIPYGVTTIGNYAFTGCSGLKHVAAPATCTNWGTYAFHNCSSLADLYVNVATPATLPNDYFSTTQHKTLHVASGKINSYKSATGWSVF
ncbi:MAG: leucine-rich repeat domain-containing protein, partial [Muribaculaceae bacterium]|nr:leucine-rich repeat domain-containing protein [Muribaculaceae bacterium]